MFTITGILNLKETLKIVWFRVPENNFINQGTNRERKRCHFLLPWAPGVQHPLSQVWPPFQEVAAMRQHLRNIFQDTWRYQPHLYRKLHCLRKVLHLWYEMPRILPWRRVGETSTADFCTLSMLPASSCWPKHTFRMVNWPLWVSHSHAPPTHHYYL